MRLDPPAAEGARKHFETWALAEPGGSKFDGKNEASPWEADVLPLNYTRGA
jgi:hypothetical protein